MTAKATVDGHQGTSKSTVVRVAFLSLSVAMLLNGDILFAVAPFTVLGSNWAVVLGSGLLVVAFISLASWDDVRSKFFLFFYISFFGAVIVSVSRSIVFGSGGLTSLIFVGLLLIAMVTARSLEVRRQELALVQNALVLISVGMAVVQLANHEFIPVTIDSDGSGFAFFPGRQMLYHPGVFGSVAVYSMAVLIAKIPTAARKELIGNLGLFFILFYASNVGISRLPGVAAAILLGFLIVALWNRGGYRPQAGLVLLLGLAIWFGLRPVGLRWETEHTIPGRLLQRYQYSGNSESIIDPVRLGEYQDLWEVSEVFQNLLIGETGFYGGNSGLVFLVMNFGWPLAILVLSLITFHFCRNITGLLYLFIVGYFLADFSLTAVIRFPGVLVFGLVSSYFISGTNKSTEWTRGKRLHPRNRVAWGRNLGGPQEKY